LPVLIGGGAVPYPADGRADVWHTWVSPLEFRRNCELLDSLPGGRLRRAGSAWTTMERFGTPLLV